MDDLVRWLGAQLDEDERIARATDDSWMSNANYQWSVQAEDDAFSKVVARGFYLVAGKLGPAYAAHIALHDPARVLREIDAKRQNLAELEAAELAMDRASKDGDTARYNEVRAGWVVLRRVVRRDAAVYAGRPGWREEWRP